jgi:hypothetical protein
MGRPCLTEEQRRNRPPRALSVYTTPGQVRPRGTSTTGELCERIEQLQDERDWSPDEIENELIRLERLMDDDAKGMDGRQVGLTPAEYERYHALKGMLPGVRHEETRRRIQRDRLGRLVSIPLPIFRIDDRPRAA